VIKVRRLRRFLRASLLALLVLGLLVRPVLLSIGDGRAAEASLVASHDGHVVHDHVDHDDNGKPCPGRRRAITVRGARAAAQPSRPSRRLPSRSSNFRPSRCLRPM